MIEARGLTRRFGSFVAVQDVSLRVPDGTVLALLGPNGAGKTTTVRMLAGLIAPSEGEARVADCDVRREPQLVRARVGLVTDAPGLYEQMSVGSYLDFFGNLYGMPAADRHRRVAELVAFFDLEGHQRERMVGFSKGMKQKVALARALLHEPRALFLDEPTSGLDPMAAKAVRELIVTLKNASRSIILCTHDLDEAERLADQIAILRQGRIVALDAPAALRANASPETTVLVELADPCPAALTALGACVDVLDPQARRPTLLEYHARDPHTTNPQVIAGLLAAGARIVSVTCQTRTLEEVYTEVMRAETLPGAMAALRGETGAANA